MNALFWLPAALSLGLLVFHVAAGGREVVRPLLGSRELQPDVVHVLYLCWHVVTIVLAMFVACYALAATDSAYTLLARLATVMAGVMALLSLAVVISKRQSHREMPQWIAFLVLAAAGAWPSFSQAGGGASAT